MNFTVHDVIGQPINASALLSPDALIEPESQLGWSYASTLCALGTAAGAGYMLWEQMKFRWYRQGRDKKLPGPEFVPPVLGGVVEMVRDPYAFWERQRLYSFPGLSWNSLVGTFIVFVTDPSLCRHVFNHNSKDTLLMDLHPSAKNVLGDHNIAFLHGPEHKALRRSFLALFTRKALSVYVQQQDVIVRRHLKEWVKESGGKAFEARPFVRELNQFTSQEVFSGPYLDDPAVRIKFGQSYRDMTDAFLAFPLCVPGTAVWRGRMGRMFIVDVLTTAVARSKAKMKAGAEPDCLVDFWCQAVLEEIDAAASLGEAPPSYSADHRMADSVMDFLFASQDASTSSLTWTLALMADHPEVLQKVREEQIRLRPDLNATLTGDTIKDMEYTRQVVREILRFRPPAPMVPQVAQAPFKINETYTAPKGTMIIPSVWAACHQGYENAHLFDPERFGPVRGEGEKFSGNFLVFGHGPHYCVGKDYAINHLVVFLALLSTEVEYTRIRSAVSDEIKYLPTLYPGDSVIQMKMAREA